MGTDSIFSGKWSLSPSHLKEEAAAIENFQFSRGERESLDRLAPETKMMPSRRIDEV